jgi:GNAT superfamily N-acetyltransferase
VRPAVANWWFAQVSGDGDQSRLIAVQSDAYPDDTHVELDTAAGELAGTVCTVHLDDGKARAVVLGGSVAPDAPPLWFAELRESSARPPATNLLAFSGHGQPPGALLDDADLSNVTVRSEDQLGAVRWYPVSGVVNQIYVAPQWRRRRVGTALLTAATTLSVARDWPRLWGQGQRTAMGEAFRNNSTWWHRAEELTHLAPPMTPGGSDAAP